MNVKTQILGACFATLAILSIPALSAAQCGGGDAAAKSSCATVKTTTADARPSAALGGGEDKDKPCCASTEGGEAKCKSSEECAAKCGADQAKACAEAGAKCETKCAAGCKSAEECASKCGAGKTKACCAPGGGSDKAKAGAATSTAAYGVGSTIQDFDSVDARTGQTAKFSALAGEKATVLIFWNQNCPYVVEAKDRIAQFHNDFAPKGIKVVAVDAGVNNSPESIKEYAAGVPFPILVNSDSRIAAQFGATRTPEVFVINKDMKVVYHGAFDSGKNKTESGALESYVATVAQAILDGKEHITETRAFGCTVKYAEGVKPLAR